LAEARDHSGCAARASMIVAPLSPPQVQENKSRIKFIFSLATRCAASHGVRAIIRNLKRSRFLRGGSTDGATGGRKSHPLRPE